MHIYLWLTMLKDLSLKTLLESEDSQEYWGTQAAGCIFISKDTGRILLALRSDEVMEPHTWGTWGGKIDAGENPVDAIHREIDEETGYDGTFKISHIYTYRDGDFRYYNYIVLVPTEFSPQLNWEHDASKWVEYGEWPSPLHFGLAELLHKAGHQIERLIRAIKKKNKLSEGSMDAPAAIHQQAQVIDKEFINYIKKVENGARIGFKNGKFMPTIDPGGGKPCIGYGHNIVKGEEKLLKGISEKQAEDLLIQDLLKARKQVHDDIKGMFGGARINMSSQQEQMLIDFAFNLGTIKGYPKFVRAVLNKDWDTVKQEFKRTYKDASGKRKELTQRNSEFSRKFLSAADGGKKPIGELQTQFHNKSMGLEDEDTFGYELRSDYSWIRYSHTPSSRLFSIQKVGTDLAHQNQGHAKAILDHFFRMVKRANGAVEVDSYTGSGRNYIKHVIEKLGELYKVRVI